MDDEQLSHKQSIELINEMIGKVKNNVYDNGISSLLWGSVIFICGIVTFCEVRGYFELPFDIWYLTILAVLPTIYLARKESKEHKVKTYDENALNYIWSVFGIGIPLIVFINIVIFNNLNPINEAIQQTGNKNPFKYSEYSSAFYLLWYGFPGIITGGIKRWTLMFVGSLACWIFAIISLFTPVDIDMLLIAFGAFFAWFIPGLVLRKRFLEHRRKNIV